MTTLVYSLREYRDNINLVKEEFYISPMECTRAASKMQYYVITLYEIAEPINPVSLLNKVNFALKFQVIEDTRNLSAEHTVVNRNRVSSFPGKPQGKPQPEETNA